MTSYTITVAPSDDRGNTTTITVDTSNGDALITDVHLHAAAGLTATRLPSIDISLLMQAVTVPPALTAPVASPALTGKATPAEVQPVAAVEDTTPVPPPPPGAGRGGSRARPAQAPAHRQGARRPARPRPPGNTTPAAAADPAPVAEASAPAPRKRRRTTKEPAVPTPPAAVEDTTPAAAADPAPAAAPRARRRARAAETTTPEATKTQATKTAAKQATKAEVTKAEVDPRTHRRRTEAQGPGSAQGDPGGEPGARLPPHARRLLQGRGPAQQRIDHRGALPGPAPHRAGMAAPPAHHRRQLIH